MEFEFFRISAMRDIEGNGRETVCPSPYGARVNPRRPRGWCPPPLRRVSRDCSGAVCDRELKFGMSVSPFKPDIINFFHVQVRSDHWPMTSLILVSKSPHGHRMPQLRNAANGRQSFSGRRKFLTVTSPQVLTVCMYISEFPCRSSEVRSVTWVVTSPIISKPMGEYWNC